MREPINVYQDNKEGKENLKQRAKVKGVEKQVSNPPREIPERLQSHFDRRVSSDIYIAELDVSDFDKKLKALKEAKKAKDEALIAKLQQEIIEDAGFMNPAFLRMAYQNSKEMRLGYPLKEGEDPAELVRKKLQKGYGLKYLQRIVNDPQFSSKYRDFVMTDAQAFVDVKNRANQMYTQEKMKAVRERIGDYQEKQAESRAVEQAIKEDDLALETQVQIDMKINEAKNLASLAEIVGGLEDITRPDGSIISMEEQAKMIKLLSDPDFSSKSMLVDYLTRQHGIRQRVKELMAPRAEKFEQENLQKQETQARVLAMALQKLFSGTAKPGEWVEHQGNEYSIDKSRKIRVRKSGAKVPGVYMKKEEQAMLQKAFQDRLEFLGDAAMRLEGDLQATMNMEDAKRMQEQNPEMSYSEAREAAREQMSEKLSQGEAQELARKIEQIYQVDVVNPSPKEERLIKKFMQSDRDFQAMYLAYQNKVLDTQLMRATGQEVMAETPVVKEEEAPKKVSWFKRVFGGRQ